MRVQQSATPLQIVPGKTLRQAPNSRPEESQPGLDPDIPGAAPDTRRGHPRLAGLGRPVSDPVWDDAERVLANCCRLMGRLREQTARGLSLIATLYLRERYHWADFLAERGVIISQSRGLKIRYRLQFTIRMDGERMVERWPTMSANFDPRRPIVRK